MAQDVFRVEMKPGDLIAFSSAGNGYIDVSWVSRVMPKSVQYGNYEYYRTNSDKCMVISEAKARTFRGTANIEHIIEESRKVKAEYGIELEEGE